jgi:integrase
MLSSFTVEQWTDWGVTMLTVKELQKLSPGRWVSDGATRGSGALWFRKSDDGKRVSVYFFYGHNGKRRKLPIATYDEQGVVGLTLSQCRDKSGEISKIYKSGVTDLHEHFEREREAGERARQTEADAARRAAEEAQHGSLRQLLAARVSYLKRKGSTDTAKDEESMFRRQVPEHLKDRKATEPGAPDFKLVIAVLVEAGHGRGAAKLRTALRAAYQLAVDSGTDPDVPLEFGAFGITVNPVASVSARSLAKYNRARERPLSAPELTGFLKRVDALDQVPQREALKLCLYLGGQRPTQLLRAQLTDIDIDAGTITLHDKKGRRSTGPRRHVLPLVKEASVILEARLAAIRDVVKRREAIGDRRQVPVFSSHDATPMWRNTLSALVKEISDNMVKEGEARAPFQLRDIRHTAETMLAALKVSKDVRAQVLSHGLGGAQNQFYDHHRYWLEKQQALKKWAVHLAKLKESKTANVVSLAKRRERAHETRQ